jgi:hypothetical protein
MALKLNHGSAILFFDIKCIENVDLAKYDLRTENLLQLEFN